MRSNAVAVAQAPPEALVAGVRRTFEIAAIALSLAMAIVFRLWRGQQHDSAQSLN